MLKVTDRLLREAQFAELKSVASLTPITCNDRFNILDIIMTDFNMAD